MKKVFKQFNFIFLISMFILIILIPSIKVSAADDYPSDLKNAAQDSIIDPWRFYNRECTSFVAWRLNNRNGVAFSNTYGGVQWGNAGNWGSAARSIGITVNNTPAVGSVAWFSSGHVAWVSEVNGDNIVIEEYNYGYDGRYYTRPLSKSQVSGFIHIKDLSSATIVGTEMTSGYSRVLPDGDYIIASAGTADKTTYLYMDIPGTDVPAATCTNVNLCHTAQSPNFGACDVWTIKYTNGFYTIKQKGTEMSLDVQGASKEAGANVMVHEDNGGSNQKWAISKNGRNGYRIQTKCSGFSVDVSGASFQNGTNIGIWTNNDSDAQSWLFIPYKPAQPIKNGNYVFVSTLDEKYALGIDKNNLSQSVINTQLTNNLKDKNSVFKITKLDNGYYKIINIATGKALELTNGYSNIGDNVNVFTENGSIPQQWEIKKVSGGYVLILRSSGMAMEVANGTAANATPIKQKYYTGDKAQVWKIVTYESLQKAKYKVIHYKEKTDGSYAKADEESATAKIGSKVTPATKSYTGFTAPSKKSVTVKSDGSTVIKYYYTRNKYKLTWDLGGGKASGSYTKGSVYYGTKITAPSSVKKTGYVFKGWSITVPDKMPAKNVTIKAKWEAKNQKEVEAYVTRFYKVFLNRKPEKEGLDYWTENLISKKMTGADVARGFVLSKEMTNRKLSNEEFVTLMYKGFFDRVPDASGYSYWVGLLESGYPKEKVVAGFVNSQEFKNLCKKYNINPGSL